MTFFIHLFANFGNLLNPTNDILCGTARTFHTQQPGLIHVKKLGVVLLNASANFTEEIIFPFSHAVTAFSAPHFKNQSEKIAPFPPCRVSPYMSFKESLQRGGKSDFEPESCFICPAPYA